MQNKLIIIKCTLSGLMLWLCSCALPQNEAVSDLPEAMRYEAFIVQKSYNDTAWGYIIEFDNHQLIQQFSIPVLEGNKLFKNKEQATVVGNLVANKLNRSLRPSITKKELDSLGITK